MAHPAATATVNASTGQLTWISSMRGSPRGSSASQESTAVLATSRPTPPAAATSSTDSIRNGTSRPRPARTEGRTHRHFPLPAHSAREQQVDDIRARDGQEEARASEQHQQAESRSADDVLAQRDDSRIRHPRAVAVLPLQLGGNRPHVGTCLLDRHAVFQTADDPPVVSCPGRQHRRQLTRHPEIGREQRELRLRRHVHEPVRVWIGQWRQQYRVDDRVYGCAGADAESKRQDDGGRKARGPQEQPKRVSNAVPQSVHVAYLLQHAVMARRSIMTDVLMHPDDASCVVNESAGGAGRGTPLGAEPYPVTSALGRAPSGVSGDRTRSLLTTQLKFGCRRRFANPSAAPPSDPRWPPAAREYSWLQGP